MGKRQAIKTGPVWMFKMGSELMGVFNPSCYSFSVLQSLIVSPVHFVFATGFFFSLKSAEEEKLHLPHNFINYTSEY